MKLLFCLIVVFVFSACCSDTPKVVVIQPFGDFSNAEAEKVLIQIKGISPNAIRRGTIVFPEGTYYKPRNRYRADELLKYLNGTIGDDSVVIGLSHADISTTKGDVKDWGVMGLGYMPGNACIVSDFRLSRKNMLEQFYKVALHELGHTQGLPHCEVRTCLMRDAEGGNPLDEEKQFCKVCRKYLVDRNWVFADSVSF